MRCWLTDFVTLDRCFLLFGLYARTLFILTSLLNFLWDLYLSSRDASQKTTTKKNRFCFPLSKEKEIKYIYLFTLLLLRFSLYKTKPEKRWCQFTSPPFFFFAPASIFIPSDLHVPLCFCSFLLHHIFLPAFHVTRERIQIGAAMSQSQRKTERTGVSGTSETLRRIIIRRDVGGNTHRCFSACEYGCKF